MATDDNRMGVVGGNQLHKELENGFVFALYSKGEAFSFCNSCCVVSHQLGFFNRRVDFSSFRWAGGVSFRALFRIGKVGTTCIIVLDNGRFELAWHLPPTTVWISYGRVPFLRFFL